MAADAAIARAAGASARPKARPSQGTKVYRAAATSCLGFSLLELILVMTIIAIIAVAVVPVFRGTLASVQTEHGVRDMVATVRYAQERAVTDSLEYRLYLDPEKGEYYLMRLEGYDEDNEKVFEPLEESIGGVMPLPKRMGMKRPRARKDRDRDAYYVAFFPSGACDDVTIDLEREDRSGSVRIKTNGALGRLEVKER